MRNRPQQAAGLHRFEIPKIPSRAARLRGRDTTHRSHIGLCCWYAVGPLPRAREKPAPFDQACACSQCCAALCCHKDTARPCVPQITPWKECVRMPHCSALCARVTSRHAPFPKRASSAKGSLSQNARGRACDQLQMNRSHRITAVEIPAQVVCVCVCVWSHLCVEPSGSWSPPSCSGSVCVCVCARARKCPQF